MRNKYIRFVSILSHIFSDKFGVVWWCGLVQEKNSSKDNLIHILLKTLQPDNPNLYRIPYDVIRKYLVFAFAYVVFKFKIKRKLNKNLFFSYYGDYFSCLYKMNDSSVLILPDRTNWRKVHKDNSVRAIYQYLSWKDFYQVPIEYIKWSLKFIKYYFNIKFCIEELGKTVLGRDDAWKLFKEQLYKSFCGQLLVENLFLQKIFHRINLENPEKVIYVYEGLGWEKLLCHVFRGRRRIGVLCTLPSDNMTNFWCDREEALLMPTPDKLLTMGHDSYTKFRRIYGFGKVELLGTTRHQYLKDIKESKGDQVLVVLGYNDQQNEKLLEWVDENYENYIVKPHPKSNLEGINFIYDDIEDCLKNAKEVVVSSDTMVAIEAMAAGVEVVMPELDGYVNLSPLCGCEYELIEDFFTFRSDKAMIRTVENL